VKVGEPKKEIVFSAGKNRKAEKMCATWNGMITVRKKWSHNEIEKEIVKKKVKKVKYELCGGSDEKKSERDEINWNWDVIDGMEMNQVNMVDFVVDLIKIMRIWMKRLKI